MLLLKKTLYPFRAFISIKHPSDKCLYKPLCVIDVIVVFSVDTGNALVDSELTCDLAVVVMFTVDGAIVGDRGKEERPLQIILPSDLP